MPALLYWILAGIGLGYATDKKSEEQTNYYDSHLFDHQNWLDRTTWYNPVRGTNADQYIIGTIILGTLYFIGKKY